MVRKRTAVSGLRRIAEDGRSGIRGWDEWDGTRGKEVSGNFWEVGWYAKIGENSGGCCGRSVPSVKSILCIYMTGPETQKIARIPSYSRLNIIAQPFWSMTGGLECLGTLALVGYNQALQWPSPGRKKGRPGPAQRSIARANPTSPLCPGTVEEL